jgi:hypothetical protein
MSGGIAGVTKELGLLEGSRASVVHALQHSSGAMLYMTGAGEPEMGTYLRSLSQAAAFRWHHTIERMSHPVRMFDAAGLALFAVAGAQKALAYELNAVVAALLGMLTAIGGGLARDLLLTQIPTVLRSDLMAARLRRWCGDANVVDARKPNESMPMIARRIPEK